MNTDEIRCALYSIDTLTLARKLTPALTYLLPLPLLIYFSRYLLIVVLVIYSLLKMAAEKGGVP